MSEDRFRVVSGTGDSQGIRLALMQELARYWGTDYDWGQCEAKLNDLPNFITEIDGLDIHFIHVRCRATASPPSRPPLAGIPPESHVRGSC